MKPDLALYVIVYYGRFMTKSEMIAHRRLMLTMKVSAGRSDADSQREAQSRKSLSLQSDDPAAVRLASDGFQSFAERTAERILAEHKEEILLNYCPRSGELARTPKARQCRFCGNDWHNSH